MGESVIQGFLKQAIEHQMEPLVEEAVAKFEVQLRARLMEAAMSAIEMRRDVNSSTENYVITLVPKSKRL